MNSTIRARPATQPGGTTAVKALAAIRKQLAEGDAAYARVAYGTAWFLWRPLADLGIVEAQNSLGVMYANGAGVDCDPFLAVQWYRRAAEQGFAPAAFNLGVAYSRGDGVEKDAARAAHWKGKAAEQGYNAPAPEPAGTTQGNGPQKERAAGAEPRSTDKSSFQSWHYPHLNYSQVEKVRQDYARAGIAAGADGGQKRGNP